MKVLLIMIICSVVQNECLPPHQMPTFYDSYYDCLQAGYKEATKKQTEIGKTDTNKHQIYIRFTCKSSYET
tara:strand:+ start:129 stop:341 length:213 start_codon:yes stop_codon:yes gene_type:complete